MEEKSTITSTRYLTIQVIPQRRLHRSSHAFEENNEMFMGTKSTLIMTRELDAYLFNEGGDNASSTTRVELSRQSAGPVADASASQAAEATSRAVDSSVGNSLDKGISYRNEIAEFCSAIRIGTPVRCGGAQAMTSAVAILTGNSSGDKKARLHIPKGSST